AVGQGALALVAREADARTRELLAPLNHAETASAVAAERAFLRSLEGGCQVPIAALASVEGDDLSLDGLVSDLEGRTILREQGRGAADRAVEVGTGLAARLLERGAGEILEEIRRSSGAP